VILLLQHITDVLAQLVRTLLALLRQQHHHRSRYVLVGV